MAASSCRRGRFPAWMWTPCAAKPKSITPRCEPPILSAITVAARRRSSSLLPSESSIPKPLRSRREPAMIDLLLTHATVVTMDPARTILEDGAVAIDQGRIVEVGPTAEVTSRHQAAKSLNCRHKVVMPGLVDAHGHGGHSLLKTIAADTGSVWMRVVTPVYFHFVTDDFWYVEGLISALERLRAGVTCGVSV